MGAVEKLIVYENLDIKRYTLRNANTEEEQIKMLSPAQSKMPESFKAADGAALETVEMVRSLASGHLTRRAHMVRSIHKKLVGLHNCVWLGFDRCVGCVCVGWMDRSTW